MGGTDSHSGCMQDPLPQQRKSRSPVHLALDRLELVDATFRLTVACCVRESGHHMGPLSPQFTREPHQFRHRTGFTTGGPLVEILLRTLVDELAKPSDQFDDQRQGGMGLTEPGQMIPLFHGQRLGPCYDEPLELGERVPVQQRPLLRGGNTEPRRGRHCWSLSRCADGRTRVTQDGQIVIDDAHRQTLLPPSSCSA